MGQNQYTRKCIEFVAFLEQNKCKFINLIHTRQQWEMLRLCSWKREIKSFENITQHQKMKTYLISQKIIGARTHQKHIPGSSITLCISINYAYSHFIFSDCLAKCKTQSVWITINQS